MTFETFRTMLAREFKLFFSNKTVLMIFFGAPLAFGLLIGATYSKAKVTELLVLVVDSDDSPSSAKLIDMINDNETLKVDKIIANEVDVADEMRKHQYGVVVAIPSRFEADLLQKRTPEINVSSNMSNIVVANFSVKAVQLILGSFNIGAEVEALHKQGMPISAASKKYEAVKVNYSKFFNPSGNYLFFLWPGVLGAIFQQVVLLVLALSFAREFESKTYISVFHKQVKSTFMAIILKALPLWCMMPICLLVFRLEFWYFDVPLNLPLLPITLLIIGMILSMTFAGILFSIALSDQLSATEFLMVIATPSFIVSGFTWPLSQMPTFVQWFANVIPLTHFLEGWRTLFLLEGQMADIEKPLIAMGILTSVFFVLSLIILKLKTMRLLKAEASI